MKRLLLPLTILLAGGLHAETPVRIAIAGLVHGHASGFLQSAKTRKDIEIVGIFDPDPALTARYGKANGIAPELQFQDLAAMLDKVHPEAVATFTSTAGHLEVVALCGPRHIPVMMEKPLAINVTEARAIDRVARANGIAVMVNYETTWFRSHGELWKIVKEQGVAGDIRRIVAMDGHGGPKEIGVGPEFLSWLIDPAKSGGGALFDFGCYGANLITWLMDGKPPIAVTAITQTNKPAIYGQTDDEATVLLQYPKAQAVIQASWNWPFDRKDLEVYGEKGYAIATGRDSLRVRLPGQAEEMRKPSDLPADRTDSLTYLAGVVRGKFKPSGLSSLENNVIVVQILQAARDSARTGKRVNLQ
jgi:predicted dehydrogenase